MTQVWTPDPSGIAKGWGPDYVRQLCFDCSQTTIILLMINTLEIYSLSYRTVQLDSIYTMVMRRRIVADSDTMVSLYMDVKVCLVVNGKFI